MIYKNATILFESYLKMFGAVIGNTIIWASSLHILKQKIEALS